MQLPQRIVLAPDSFKESMSAKAACEAMAAGIHQVAPQIDCISVPMADGGEGTMAALIDATNGTRHQVAVHDALGRPLSAEYGILGDGHTAVVEVASASGLPQLAPEERQPLCTTSFGTGELIDAALQPGITTLLLTLGGSATNDAGIGIVQALGARVLDQSGQPVPHGGGHLQAIATIDLAPLKKRLAGITVVGLSDVTNPLTGPQGATAIFGPQKGAESAQLQQLEAGVNHVADLVQATQGVDLRSIVGGGAAGGIGAAVVGLLNGTLRPGIDAVTAYTHLEDAIAAADMVWTGEGSIDFQTQFGKTPMGVAAIAQRLHKPVIGFAGRIGEGSDVLYAKGFTALFCIMQGALPLEAALAQGEANLTRVASDVIRLLS